MKKENIIFKIGSIFNFKTIEGVEAFKVMKAVQFKTGCLYTLIGESKYVIEFWDWFVLPYNHECRWLTKKTNNITGEFQ